LIEKATALAADIGAAWVVSGELVVSGYRFQPLLGKDWITSSRACGCAASLSSAPRSG
jgi:hypothetical protein